MNNWLIVRSVDDLGVALQQVNGMFGSSAAGKDESVSLKLHGVWIDADMASHPPMQLLAPDEAGADTSFHVHEVIGLTGIWQLFRLKAANNDAPAEPKQILAALIEQSQPYTGVVARQMIPVITVQSVNEDNCEFLDHLMATAQAKDINFPAVWYQDPLSGRCQQADASIVH